MRVKPKAKFLHDKTLERSANNVIARYETQGGAIIAPPIPVELIIEQLLDLTIDHEEMDWRILGYIDINERVIRLNALRRDLRTVTGRYEFTLAHEVGHYELHFEEEPELISDLFDAQTKRIIHREDVDNKDPYFYHEVQANKFASYLLMPIKLLKPLIKEVDLLDASNIRRIAALFAVSYEAMLIRLQGLNLVYAENGKLYRSRQEAAGQLSLPL